jgi:hypothetical protein
VVEAGTGAGVAEAAVSASAALKTPAQKIAAAAAHIFHFTLFTPPRPFVLYPVLRPFLGLPPYRRFSLNTLSRAILGVLPPPSYLLTPPSYLY